MKGSQKRKHERRALPLLVQYRFGPLDEFHTDYSVNISGGGLLLHVGQPPALGTTVYLQFIMRGQSRMIQCRGRVVRVDRGDPKTRLGPGCGVQFIDLDDDDLAAIIALTQKG